MKNIKPIFFYITFFLFCLGFSLNAVGYDFDLWARLIAGMSVVQSGMVLKQDFLSYTPTHIWYDHEWGSGVIFYVVQHLFSAAGLIFLQAILVFLIFFLITKIVALRGVKTTSAHNLLFYFFAFQAMSVNLNEPVRCHLFSFLFFTLFLYLLELSRKGNFKPLWLMPFIMIFWNNIHGGCTSGIGLIIIYIVGEFLNKKPVKRYIYVLIPTIFVLLINPWGFQYLKFLFMANTMQRPEITEWWGLFSKYHMFGYLKFKLFELVILLSELGLVLKNISYKNLDKTKFLLLLVTFGLAFEHVKLIPFFVITTVCFLYDDFYTMLDKITPKFLHKLDLAKDIFVYSIILLFSLSAIYLKGFEPLVNFSRYPVKEIEFIHKNNIKGNLLINFGLGSYASYKLYPNNKIFMDGRYEEVYYDDMVPMLKKFYLLNAGWDEVLIKYKPDVMVIEKNYPVYVALKKNPDWALVYEGKLFGVFMDAQKNKSGATLFKAPSDDINYYKKTIFDTSIKFN